MFDVNKSVPVVFKLESLARKQEELGGGIMWEEVEMLEIVDDGIDENNGLGLEGAAVTKSEKSSSSTLAVVRSDDANALEGNGLILAISEGD